MNPEEKKHSIPSEFFLPNNSKKNCKVRYGLTKQDRYCLNEFIKTYGRNKFFWFGIIPINYNKWATIGKLISIIESFDQNYFVNITKYSTTIYRIHDVAFIPVYSSYAVISPFNNDDKITVIIKAIVGFCKNYKKVERRERELIEFDYFLQKYDKYKK